MLINTFIIYLFMYLFVHLFVYSLSIFAYVRGQTLKYSAILNIHSAHFSDSVQDCMVTHHIKNISQHNSSVHI